MKVFFCLDALINAGSEKSTLDIVSKFSSDTEVHVVYFYPIHQLRDSYLLAGIRLHFLELNGKYAFMRGTKLLIKLIQAEKPDLIVSSIFRANIISRLACLLTNTKLVGTFISDSYSKDRIKSFNGRRKIGFYLFKWLDKITSGIPILWISNSNAIIKANCKELGISPTKVRVIHRGRETSMMPFWVAPNSKEPFIFIAIGRLLITKGYREMIYAIKKIHFVNTNVKLHIYGEGSDRPQLEELIKSLTLEDCVILFGNKPNACQYLSTAHCFIFSSWYEGFSGTLVEAMMAGIPIIASNIEMNLEALTDEKTALVHKLYDIDDIVDKMVYAFNNFNQMVEMGRSARKIAFQRYDIQLIAKSYEHLLSTIN